MAQMKAYGMPIANEGIHPLLRNFSPSQTIFNTFDVMANKIVIISTNDESNCDNQKVVHWLDV